MIQVWLCSFKVINPYSAGIDFSGQVCRSQILTSKVDLRTVRIEIFLMVVDT